MFSDLATVHGQASRVTILYGYSMGTLVSWLPLLPCSAAYAAFPPEFVLFLLHFVPFCSRVKQQKEGPFFVCFADKACPFLFSVPPVQKLTANSRRFPGGSIPSRAGPAQRTWYIVPAGAGYILVCRPARGVRGMVPPGHRYHIFGPPAPGAPARAWPRPARGTQNTAKIVHF